MRVLITGASSGIGREIAILVSELNGRTVLLGRDQPRLEETRMRLRGNGHEILAIDLRDVDLIPGMVKAVTSDGALSGAVHAAGIQATMSLQSMCGDTLDRVMRTNVYAAVMLARGLKQKGCAVPGCSFVIVGSVMGMVSRPALSAYTASKAAVLGLVKSLALELAPKIRVNSVSPAFVESEMMERLKATVEVEQFEAIRAMHPLGFGTARDVAHSVAFLLGDTARWITGTNLVVDGGYSAH